MIKKKYPLIIFGIIGAYHIGMTFIGADNDRKTQLDKAEAERVQRLKEI